LQSYAARLNYNLYNKYLFTASLRADGSSKFDPTGPNQYGYFPSGAFAWKLGDENFIKNIKAISSAKFRASYGVTGNNRIGPFDYLSRITFYNNSNAFYTFGNTLSQAFTISSLGNKDLKWESTGQFDMGLELGFFRDRILLELDLYRKRTYDLLLNTPIAPGSGFTNIVSNVGKTQNQGFEITLNTINVKNKSFSWNSNFNISFNRNKILELNGATDNLISIVGGQGNALANVPGYIAKVGKPISQMYGFVFTGNYQVSDFDLLPNGTYILKGNVPHSGGDINVTRANQKPGDPRYADINGDGLINNDDITIIGDPNPIHIGGLSNNFAYKNFDLNVFLQWSYGNDVYNANRIHFEGGTPIGAANNNNQFASYNDRWTFENPTNKNFRAFAINGQYANGTRVTNSRVVEDASFLRLKTIQLGYNVANKFIKRAGIKSLRAYASAQNLFTWTKYTGMDPEVNTRGTGLTAGYDFSAYPRALTYTFGLNLSL
jgi:TonB-linked SusC/RagA family outer membrane protein